MKKNESKISNKKEPSKSSIKTSPIDLFRKSIDEYFKNASINTATYLQSISDLQQEIIESRKKNAESIIYLQKCLVEQVNSHSKMSSNSLDILTDFAENSNKAWNFQNRLMQKSIEVLSNNIKAFNKNTQELTEMNKKIIESWADIIKKSKNKN